MSSIFLICLYLFFGYNYVLGNEYTAYCQRKLSESISTECKTYSDRLAEAVKVKEEDEQVEIAKICCCSFYLLDCEVKRVEAFYRDPRLVVCDKENAQYIKNRANEMEAKKVSTADDLCCDYLRGSIKKGKELAKMPERTTTTTTTTTDAPTDPTIKSGPTNKKTKPISTGSGCGEISSATASLLFFSAAAIVILFI